MANWEDGFLDFEVGGHDRRIERDGAVIHVRAVLRGERLMSSSGPAEFLPLYLLFAACTLAIWREERWKVGVIRVSRPLA